MLKDSSATLKGAAARCLLTYSANSKPTLDTHYNSLVATSSEIFKRWRSFARHRRLTVLQVTACAKCIQDCPHEGNELQVVLGYLLMYLQSIPECHAQPETVVHQVLQFLTNFEVM